MRRRWGAAWALAAMAAALAGPLTIPPAITSVSADQDPPRSPTTDPAEQRSHVLFDDTTAPPRPGVQAGARASTLTHPKRPLGSRSARPQGGARPTAGPRAAAGAPTAPPDPEVLGFAQSGEVDSGAWIGDLRMNLLSTVAYFGVNVAGDGSLIASDYGYQVWTGSQTTNLINSAHSAGDRVVLTIKQFDTPTIDSITGSESNRQTCINSVIQQLSNRGGDGVNVDFEGYDSSASARSNFVTFIGELDDALRSRLPQSSYLTVDTYGSSAQGGTMFDIVGLRSHLDAFDVMAYDLTSPSSANAGPVAPMNGYAYTVNGIVSGYLNTAQVAPSQLILGVPYYGYKWSVSSPDPQASTAGTGSAETYAAALSDFTCAQQLSRHFDTTFYEPWATWYSPAVNDPCGGNHGSWRELYYEDAQALGAKYDLVNGDHLDGVGIWALGYDSGHSDLWDEISAKFTVTHGSPRPAVASDFDGDHRADPTVVRPSTSTWYTVDSNTSPPYSSGSGTPFGQAGDIPVPADYLGEGRVQDAVFRPSAHAWYIRSSLTGAITTVSWGTTGDIPVPGDYQGAGTAQIAVYRPGAPGTWYLLNSARNGYTAVNWGTTGDIPVPGDYQGAGAVQIGIYRPGAPGTWYILNSARNGYTAVNWGTTGDIPVPGDYQGAGAAQIAVYRPGAPGTWYLLNSTRNAYTALNWGTSGDVPVPADYDGVGMLDIAVYRPGSTSTWYLLNSARNAYTAVNWGTTGDVPVVLPSAIRQRFFS